MRSPTMALGWLVGPSAESSTYGHEGPCQAHEGYQADWLANARGGKDVALAAASQVLKPFSRDLCPRDTPHPLEP